MIDALCPRNWWEHLCITDTMCITGYKQIGNRQKRPRQKRPRQKRPRQNNKQQQTTNKEKDNKQQQTTNKEKDNRVSTDNMHLATPVDVCTFSSHDQTTDLFPLVSATGDGCSHHFHFTFFVVLRLFRIGRRLRDGLSGCAGGGSSAPLGSARPKESPKESPKERPKARSKATREERKNRETQAKEIQQISTVLAQRVIGSVAVWQSGSVVCGSVVCGSVVCGGTYLHVSLANAATDGLYTSHNCKMHPQTKVLLTLREGVHFHNGSSMLFFFGSWSFNRQEAHVLHFIKAKSYWAFHNFFTTF